MHARSHTRRAARHSHLASFGTARGVAGRPKRRTLRFEALEDRSLLSVFTVNTNDDLDYAGGVPAHTSLREAITTANLNPGEDRIEFNIPGAGPHTIRPTSPLPAISDPVTIDGYTQPGAAGNTSPAPGGLNTVLAIELDGSLAGSDADGLSITAGASTITGLAINRFAGNGIIISCVGGNTIAGNFIGTDITGRTAAPNQRVGVWLASPGNQLGGPSPAAANLISGNGACGVAIAGSAATGNLVQGNLIGVDVTAAEPLGNGNNGLTIFNGASAATVGPDNTIAYNANYGVWIDSGTSSAIRTNSIFSNGNLGIELSEANGANHSQAAPVLTSAVASLGNLTVTGTLAGAPDTLYSVELFASHAPDPSGFGEGEFSLGATGVTTDGSGQASFSATLPLTDPAAGFIAATATDPADNTSEFSNVLPATRPPVARAAGPYAVAAGESVTLDASASTDPDQDPADLIYAWDFDGDGQFDDASGPAPTFSTTGLAAPASVTIGLRVTDEGGLSDTAQTVVDVFDAAVPQDFSILGPTGTVGTMTPEVSWEASPGAVGYDVVVSTAADLQNPLQQFHGLTATHVGVGPLADGIYYVGVTALGQNVAPMVHAGRDVTIDEGTYFLGFGFFSDPAVQTQARNNGLAFSVVRDLTPPGPFSILEPSGLVNLQRPTLAWESATHADFYDVVIASDSALQTVVQSYPGVTDTSLVPAEPLADGTYYLGVTAGNVAGNSTAATNQGLAFTVDATPPGDFAILGPSGTVATQTPLVSWQPAAGAVGYDVVVSASADLSSPVQQLQGLTATEVTLGPLANGSWYVGVTALDVAGNQTSASNQGLGFVVAYVAPKYHRVFITSSDTKIDSSASFPPPFPNWGGINGADWVCTSFAFDAGLIADWDGLTLIYRAIISTSASPARTRLSIEGKIYNFGGQVVADSAAQFWSSSHYVGMDYNEYGLQVAVGVEAWTGTTPDGSWSQYSCSAWNSTTGTATTGVPSNPSSAWASGDSRTCADRARLYALSPAISQLLLSGSIGPGASDVTDAMLQSALAQAAAYWAGAGLKLPWEPISDRLHLGAGDLPGSELSNSLEDVAQILVDHDAAGHGWSIAGEPDRVDLLSTLAHELGHVLGLGHEDMPRYDVMADTLAPGTQPTSIADWQQATSENAGGWTATVDYGDDSGVVPLILNADKTFGLAHHYPQSGTYTVTVTVTDPQGATSTDTRTVTVGNVRPTPFVQSTETTLLEGGTFASPGRFVDPGADTWTATVDYGDGSGPEPLALAPDKTFQLEHVYRQDGNYTITVSVTDSDGAVGTGEVPICVRNVLPEFTAIQLDKATIGEGDAVILSAEFADPGLLDEFDLAIDWGDGTPNTLESFVGGERSFSFSHTYADAAGPGEPYAIAVSLRDRDSATPAGFTEWQGHAYGWTEAANCWWNSELAAEGLNGMLATIGSAEQQAFLDATLLVGDHAAKPAWIGLNDRGAEGEFVWESGEPLVYANWQPGQPSGGEGEHFVAVNWDFSATGDPAAQGTWNDLPNLGTSGAGNQTDGPYFGIVEVPVSVYARLEVTVLSREVVGRQVFYNHSSFDGNDPLANAADGAAIAVDKTPLRPGQAATLANYTSYDKGINGIMVDIAELPVESLTVADFGFMVGNGGDLANWTAAPGAVSIDVLPGMGIGGADRVTIIWPDGAIKDQWLQITVLATGNTGLAEPDVFYFGNAVGEAGNAAGNAIVNATDEIMARNFYHGALNPASIDDPYDYNRDGLVNGTDQIIAREHQTNPLTMLRLITAPPVETKAAATDSDLLEPSLAELNWLYELQQMNNRHAKRTSAAEAAVDELLATYW